MPNYLCFTANIADSYVRIYKEGSPASSNFQYSRDGNTWYTFTPEGDPVYLDNVGDKIYIKGRNPNGVNRDISNHYYFSMWGSISASGNIMSLIDNGACTTTTIPGDFCFIYMFSYCTSLTTAPELPATTIGYYCYYNMFSKCTSLIAPPELPATTLADCCYQSMFSGCTSLTTAPLLPATIATKYCYAYMFRNCTSLTDPPALPAIDLHDNCYAMMFQGCTSLTTIPILSSNNLTSGCYRDMFSGCTSLITVPELPATNLESGCYREMFKGCTSLVSAPELPATTLAQYCYTDMFNGCSSLQIMPSLPATTLAIHCYDSMFKGCISLKTLSVLPATVLATDCYYRMFFNCSSLTVAERSTSTAMYCWTIPSSGTFRGTCIQEDMFYGCSGTRTSNHMSGASGNSYTYYTSTLINPTIITFESNCYITTTKDISGSSFYQLTEEDLYPRSNHGYLFDDWYTDSSYSTKAQVGQSIYSDTTLYGNGNPKYLVDIRGEGDIQKNGIEQNAQNYKLDTARKMLNDNIYIYAVTHDYDMGWELRHVGPKPTNLEQTHTYTGSEITNGYICPDHVNMVGIDRGVEEGVYIATYTPQRGYCWQDGSLDSVTIIMNIVYPNYLCFTANSAGSTVSMTGSGSPIGSDFQTSTDRKTWINFIPGTTTIILSNAGDKVYFKGNNPNGLNANTSNWNGFRTTGSVGASGNIMSLIDNGACNTYVIPCAQCFCYLFNNCMALTTPPELPATTLTNYCYNSMFYNCRSLISAPELPATTVAEGCYNGMFNSCSQLLTPPSELPATTLAYQCYRTMFQQCSSLISAPELPATELALNCYEYMFRSCTTLTTAPELPATTLYNCCYQYMFQNCTSLTHSPVLSATTLTSSCYRSMFQGCTSLATAPTLSATALGINCYYSMFSGCTSLTSVPELPAVDIKSQCYAYMFEGCTSLIVSDASEEGSDKAWIIPKNGTGSGTGRTPMTNMFSECLGTRSGDDPDSPSFNGIQKTYYTQNIPV